RPASGALLDDVTRSRDLVGELGLAQQGERSMRHGVSAKIEPSRGSLCDDGPVGRQVGARDVSNRTGARVPKDDRAITAQREQPVVPVVRRGSSDDSGVIPPEHGGVIWSTTD